MHLIEKKIRTGRYTNFALAQAAVRRSKLPLKEKHRLIDLAKSNVPEMRSHPPIVNEPKNSEKDQKLNRIALQIFIYAAANERPISDVHNEIKQILERYVKHWGIDELDKLI